MHGRSTLYSIQWQPNGFNVSRNSISVSFKATNFILVGWCGFSHQQKPIDGHRIVKHDSEWIILHPKTCERLWTFQNVFTTQFIKWFSHVWTPSIGDISHRDTNYIVPHTRSHACDTNGNGAHNTTQRFRMTNKSIYFPSIDNIRLIP